MRHPARRTLVATSVVALVTLLTALLGIQPAAAVGDTYSINDVSSAEGNAGTTVFTFTVTKAGSGGGTVSYAVQPGTATAGEDYAATSDSLTFLPGDPSETVTVTVNGDTKAENNETFNVVLTPAPGGTCGDCTGVGTIQNDDGPLPAIFVDNPNAVLEGTGTGGTVVFNVRLDRASTDPVTFNFNTTADGTASPTSDFPATGGTRTFATGETLVAIAIQLVGDTTDEEDETFALQITNPVNATILDGRADVTITDDDAEPSVSIAALFTTEDAATAGKLQVTLSAASGKTVTVSYSTADGTATAPGDYAAVSAGVITFTPGETVKTTTIAVVNDAVDEPDEAFTVTLTGASNATIDPTKASATQTITNDDGPPVVSVANATVAEGASGTTTNLVFRLTLTPDSGKTVIVQYATADGTATATTDYTPTSGTATFAPGQTAVDVSVPVIGDAFDEPNETLFLNLTAPSNATVGAAQGTGTITDDDATPTLSISDATVDEGGATATTPAEVTVMLSAPSNQTVTVQYATANGTATQPGDYTSTSGTLTFAPGQTTKSISVPVKGDTVSEPDETVLVNLSTPVNAEIADGQGLITIKNDDGVPTLDITDATVNEGPSGTVVASFTVSLSAPSSSSITVPYTTVDGSATAPEDYSAATSSITFAPGETSKNVLVSVKGDTIPEPTESFIVRLTAPAGTAAGKTDGIGTITNDDATAPALSIGDVTLAEGNAATTAFVFTVTRNGSTAATVTVDYAVTGGTATAGSDFTPVPAGTLTFAPDEPSKTITVQVNGDRTTEPSETFTVDLTNARNATTDPQAIGTITNDDAAPVISIGDVTVIEGNAPGTTAVFSVTLDRPSSSVVTVAFATATGTATGTDFTGQSGSVSFAAGETEKTITVAITGDTLDEADEAFTVTLSSPSNGSLGDSQAIGNITDDDGIPTLSIDDKTVAEGNANAVFTVTLSAASGQTVTVNYTTADGTAGSADYTTAAGTLTFTAGDTSETITVPVKGDALDETNETFVVNLSGAVNATTADAQGVGTITDDDAAPTFAVNDVTITEGNTGTVNATFTVTKAGTTSQTATVAYSTSNGTAGSGDYTATSGTLTFGPADTTKTIVVAVRGDTVDEANETFTVVLASPANATLADASGTGTITDDDEPAPTPAPNPGPSEPAQGYSLVGEDGSLYAFGTAKNVGDMRGTKLNAPIIGVAYTPGGNGYWLVAKDGGIFTFGNAEFYGSTGDKTLAAPVIGMAATPTGNGYWLFASDGGIFTFGDAKFFGSMGGQKLNQPVINMEPLESGNGYWLVAADGGIFSFGQAEFFGSMGDKKLNQPVFDMTSTDTDNGYWLVARDGGVFSFGDAEAKFYGNPVNDTNPRPTRIIGMDSTPGSLGYWIADASGKVWNYGNAKPLGDRFGANNPAPMIGFSAVPGLKL